MSMPQPEPKPFDELIGERVHMLMWRADRKQSEIVKATGIDQSQISKKLRGRVRWYASEVAAVASLLNTTAAYLYGETDDPTPPWAPRDSNPQPTGLQSSQVRGSTENVVTVDFGHSADDDHELAPLKIPA